MQRGGQGRQGAAQAVPRKEERASGGLQRELDPAPLAEERVAKPNVDLTPAGPGAQDRVGVGQPVLRGVGPAEHQRGPSAVGWLDHGALAEVALVEEEALPESDPLQELGPGRLTRSSCDTFAGVPAIDQAAELGQPPGVDVAEAADPRAELDARFARREEVCGFAGVEERV